ncbi:MAG TPA: M23 family metallopeptidase [Roseiflexaceae bacterium]|nr:M23 family metallopeptidase [Roseiflexaceae bacterium]
MTATLAVQATATATATSTAAPPAPASLIFSYPIGMPGKPLGDGFFIRHGYAVENTWYNPGYWHTGEDWYAVEGDTAGAQVYAIADGEVVYAGANYPGRVVIVRHAADLYSMYGHLDPRLNARVGQQLARGDLIGTVLRRGDATPNHLHFEVRVFLATSAVNGDRPRYPFRCGRNCPPGPGYWPIDAPDHPSALGWRNPLHLIARRMLPEGAAGQVAVAGKPVSDTATLWSAPPDDRARQPVGELRLHPGERYSLLELRAGPEATEQTSALAYQLWYRIRLPDGRDGWVQAAVPSTFETGSDGRPSSVYFNFLSEVETPP